MFRGYRLSVWTVAVAWIHYDWGTTLTTPFTWGFTVETPASLSPRSVERQQLLVVGDLRSHRPKHGSVTDFSDRYLENSLMEYGWDDRLVTLSVETLPVLAEFQHDGAIQIGKILRLEFPNDQEVANIDKPPKFIVEMLSSVPSKASISNTTTATFKIDLGQLTTIWSTTNDWKPLPSIRDLSTAHWLLQNRVSLSQVDRLLEESYNAAVHRRSEGSSLSSSSSSSPVRMKKQQQRQRVERQRVAAWTKKELQQRIDGVPTSVSFARKDQIALVLRQIAKAGPRHELLVDSQAIAESLPPIYSDSQEEGHSVVPPPLIQKAIAAHILDRSGGGRFKRMPCLFVSSDNALGAVTVVNGGWLAVDSAVRAASEARALAQTGASRGTNADERIVQRLEYLAMSRRTRASEETTIEKEDLQIDVREYLKVMKLPFSAEGAKEALIQIGIWSPASTETNMTHLPQPWSASVLKAVDWYQAMDHKRNARLSKNLMEARRDVKTAAQPISSLEGRFDLTQLPCICVDAARTSFRDDAIGIRPRALTGRKVSDLSKWEILIHTADVSDLYSPKVVERSEQLQLLQAAAAKRGTSRYDLPSGPLHLLPPSLLETLSLQTIHPDNAEVTNTSSAPSFNRCITLWVYIDETTGKLLDSGLERTLISKPLALTFQSATDLLEGGKTSDKLSPSLAKAKALLGIVERDLTLWIENRRETSTSAKAREERLKTREQVDRHINGDSGQRDDGSDGFRRTRGHRLVDMCLDMHGYALMGLLKRAKANVPYVAGTARDGRIATAPLRRYIDGITQRQALAVLCGYGGEPLSNSECVEVGLEATKSINAISNIQTFKPASSHVATRTSSSKLKKQQQAARALLHRMSQNHVSEEEGFVAMSTGKQSEVVILAVGAVATCKGITGTLKPGEKVLVEIQHVDPLTGQVKVALLEDGRVGKQ